MPLEDIKNFQLKKVNPFPGLIIDADAWKDAHNYHRDQQRIHILAFHQTGIVEGMGVTASGTADLSVSVQPGLAIDPAGNIIVVLQKQQYRLQTQKSGLIYLIIQFREVPTDPYQPPNGGQPTRLLDAYRIEERDKLPGEAYLELARIDFDTARGAIQDARSSSPSKNEIDLRFRHLAQQATTERPAVPAPVESVERSVETMAVGHAVLGNADNSLHLAGLQNLMRLLGQQSNVAMTMEASVTLGKDLKRFTLLYLTGKGKFELAAEQQTALSRFLQSGGTILGEGCTDGTDEGQAKAAKEFGLAFNQVATQLKRKLEIVKRGHPLLSAAHVFSEVPAGAESGVLLEGGHMIYSASDYGCAWQGGHENQPLPRESIRTAFEVGNNIAAYARAARAGG
jgi:hypothetical protein